ncbi:putative Endonuclease V, partial [Cardiosporidium cionae]
ETLQLHLEAFHYGVTSIFCKDVRSREFVTIYLSFVNRAEAQMKDLLIEYDDFDWILDSSAGDESRQLNRIGGLDISPIQGYPEKVVATLSILDFRTLKVLRNVTEIFDCKVPYIPSFLGAREGPIFAHLIHILKEEHLDLLPQVLIVDGNGMYHTRGFGSACYVGVKTDIPTIGVAKTLLAIGNIDNKYIQSNQNRLAKRGDYYLLNNKEGKHIGAVLLSSATSKKPLYVSTGHRISLGTCISIVLSICKHRLCEPLREADSRSRQYGKKLVKKWNQKAFN